MRIVCEELSITWKMISVNFFLLAYAVEGSIQLIYQSFVLVILAVNGKPKN